MTRIFGKTGEIGIGVAYVAPGGGTVAAHGQLAHGVLALRARLPRALRPATAGGALRLREAVGTVRAHPRGRGRVRRGRGRAQRAPARRRGARTTGAPPEGAARAGAA